MQITIDTDALTDKDATALAAMLGVLFDEQSTAAEEPKPRKTRAKKAAAKPVAKEEPAEEEPAAEPAELAEEEPAKEEVDDAPTVADAVEAATILVSDGKQRAVKRALEAVDTKRVSEIAEEDVAAFLKALKAEVEAAEEEG